MAEQQENNDQRQSPKANKLNNTETSNENRHIDSPKCTQTQPPSSPIPQYKNAREYAQALRSWLWHYQTSCAMHSFFMANAQMQTIALLSNSGNISIAPNNNNTSAPRTRNRLDPYGDRRPENVQNGGQQQQNQDNNRPANEGVVVKIPTFWKRVAAELIDFTMLFYIKTMVSLIMMSEFSLDQLSILNSEDLFSSFNELDYDKAFAITFEVIALEIINRVLITIFETMCLYRARVNGVPVGATPGKRLLGLKVVSCDHIRGVGPGQAMVSPAGSISLKNAFLRSVIKNFTIAFFFPACLTIFFFKHNRAAYDVISHTVVVEEVI